jgi:hypothetical protein
MGSYPQRDGDRLWTEIVLRCADAGALDSAAADLEAKLRESGLI